MPKAKLYRNLRTTKAPVLKRHRKKEEGRPKGTFKRFRFEETKLGFFLKYEVPVAYDIIMNMTPASPFPEPPLLLIKIICNSSPDPSFKKKKYQRFLDEYARDGLYCRRPKAITPERRKYYESIRKKKMDTFVRKNRERLEQMKHSIT